MALEDYLSTPGWSETVVEQVRGRPTVVWRERPRRIVDLLRISTADPALDLLVQGERRITFGAFSTAVLAGAAALGELGTRPGDRVLLVLHSSPEALLAQWAAWRLGAVPVLANRWWSGPELAEVRARVRPRVVVTDLPTDPAADDGAEQLHPDGVARWWSRPAPPGLPEPAPAEDDVAMIVFTAGSTGSAKGVQLTHRNLLWTQQTLHVMRGSRPAAPTAAADQQVALMTTPLFHNGAVTAGLSALLDGNRMVLLRGRFDAGEVLALIERERVSSWNAVPTMYARVFDHPDFARHDVSSLRAPSTGGMMVPARLLEAASARLPDAPGGLTVGYGMTEMAFLTMIAGTEARRRPGAVGKPIPGAEIEVREPDGNGEGELVARSAAMMAGYLPARAGDPGAGDPGGGPIDDAGWYHTGDLGRIDADGFVHVTGRGKDMVIRGGENVACPHVEDAIAEHPDVREVAVFGVPDGELGEAVAAVVARRPDARGCDERALTAFLRERLAYFEIPTRWELTADRLPTLPTGKIDKQALRRHFPAAGD